MLLIYVLSGNHGASWSILGLALPFLVWGVLCGSALVMRRPWASKSFVWWAIASSVGLGACGMTAALPWSSVLTSVAGLLLACGVVVVTKPIAS